MEKYKRYVPSSLSMAGKIELYKKTFRNGGVKAKFEVYFDLANFNYNAEEKIRSAIGKSSMTSADDVRKFLDSRGGHRKYIYLVLKQVRKWIDYYGGFPSEAEPIKRIVVYFQYNTHGAFAASLNGSFCRIRLGIEDAEIKKMVRTVYHETSHFIARTHHNENELTSQLNALEESFAKKIKFSQQVYDENLKQDISSFASIAAREKGMNPEDIQDYLNNIHNNFNSFIAVYLKKFHNIVADIGLIILANETGVDAEYSEYLASAKKSQTFFELESIILHKAYVKSKDREMREFLGEAAEQVSKVARILFFLEAFTHYPFFLLPYAKLGKKWHPGEKIKPDAAAVAVLKDFKKLVRKKCREFDMDYAPLKRVFRAFERMVDYHKVRNRLGEKNMEKQIHDTGAIELAKEALAVLQEEYFALCRKNYVKLH